MRTGFHLRVQRTQNRGQPACPNLIVIFTSLENGQLPSFTPLVQVHGDDLTRATPIDSERSVSVPILIEQRTYRSGTLDYRQGHRSGNSQVTRVRSAGKEESTGNVVSEVPTGRIGPTTTRGASPARSRRNASTPNTATLYWNVSYNSECRALRRPAWRESRADAGRR